MLLHLIKHQLTNIDKIYLYLWDPLESLYKLLINSWEKIGIKTLQNSKASIHCSQTIDDVYENSEDHNSTNKNRVLIVFDDMITDMEATKQLHAIVTELFLIRERKLDISLAFISQSYFKMLNTIKLNATHYFIMKLPNKRELNK